ncbi:MAG: STAS domain-containing protein [Armatimonadetes bacterium]|nr:STAS domain-containing protein [Armatimonadota bacterium]
MIVYTSDDTLKLSGALVRNQWLTIKAAAMVLLKEHPEGILIDGGELETVTEDGARTFLDAVKDIQSAGARIVVCNLPEAVLTVLKAVPGVRSQIALSMSVAEARDSLRSAGSCSDEVPDGAILVPLMDGIDTATALRLAATASRERALPVGIVTFVVIPRQLPLGAPQPEEEAEAQRVAAEGAAVARRMGLPCAVHLERVRDRGDGLLAALTQHKARMVVVALKTPELEDDARLQLTDMLLRKAPCDVLIARAVGNGAGAPMSATNGGRDIR